MALSTCWSFYFYVHTQADACANVERHFHNKHMTVSLPFFQALPPLLPLPIQQLTLHLPVAALCKRGITAILVG